MAKPRYTDGPLKVPLNGLLQGGNSFFKVDRLKWSAFSKEHLPRTVFLIKDLSEWNAHLHPSKV